MRKLLFVAGLAAVAAAVAKKVADQRTPPIWHTPDTDASHEPVIRPVPDLPKPAEPADDVAGASPDEAAADRVEEPHVPTTPDAPAEKVTLAAVEDDDLPD